MIEPGELTRRVTFQQRGLDENGDPLGDWADVVTRDARIQPLIMTNAKSAEPIIAQRLEGHQPVVIYVRREALTRNIDNSFRAFDARNPVTVWAISSAIWNEATDMMEFLSVQHRGGSDA